MPGAGSPAGAASRVGPGTWSCTANVYVTELMNESTKKQAMSGESARSSQRTLPVWVSRWLKLTRPGRIASMWM